MKHLTTALTLLALSGVSAHALQTSLDFEPMVVTKVTTNTLPSMVTSSCTETASAELGSTHHSDSVDTASSVISCQSAPAQMGPGSEFVDATTQYEEKLQIVDIKQPHAIEAGDQIASR